MRCRPGLGVLAVGAWLAAASCSSSDTPATAPAPAPDAGPDAAADAGGADGELPPVSSCPPESALDAVGAPERRSEIQQTAFDRTVALTRIENVTYGRHGGFVLQADVIRPTALPSPAPGVMVFVHGGGWKECDNRRASIDPVARFWAAAFEVGVFNVEYRLLGEGGGYPENVRDVRCAMRWARAQAASYGLDGSRMVLMGDSAGAHLVAQAALTLDRDDLDDPSCGGELPQVNGVVGFSGPYDLASFARATSFPNASVTAQTGDSPQSIVTAFAGPCVDARIEGCVAGRCEPACVDASPAAHACRAKAPFLLVHAPDGLDPLVPLSQAEALRDALVAAGKEVTLRVPARAEMEALNESSPVCTPALSHGYSPCLVFTTLEDVASFVLPKLR